MSTDRKLTLEDVEVCLKVVAEFMRQYRRAEKLMRVVSRKSTGFTLGHGNLMDLILSQSMARAGESVDEEELELSEEDVKRLEDIVGKYKSEAKKESSG